MVHCLLSSYLSASLTTSNLTSIQGQQEFRHVDDSTPLRSLTIDPTKKTSADRLPDHRPFYIWDQCSCRIATEHFNFAFGLRSQQRLRSTCWPMPAPSSNSQHIHARSHLPPPRTYPDSTSSVYSTPSANPQPCISWLISATQCK